MVQTGRCFTIRYNEHKQAFCNNSHTFRFAQHRNEKGHSFDTINNIMQMLYFQKEGTHLNTTERFHIHTEHTANIHLNDNHTIFNNANLTPPIDPPPINPPPPPHTPKSVYNITIRYKAPIHTKIWAISQKQRQHTHTHAHPLQ